MRAMARTLALAALATSAAAQVVVSDDFSYVGNLSANGWIEGGAFPMNPPMADGQVATLQYGISTVALDESVFLSFSAFGPTEPAYARFDFEIPSGATSSVGFQSSITDLGATTLLFLSPSAAGDYRLRVQTFGFPLPVFATWPVDLSFDTQYTLVLRWDQAAKTSTLWVDPVDAASANVAAAHASAPAGPATSFWLHLTDALFLFSGIVELDNVILGKTFADVVPPTGGPATYCTGKTNSLGCVPFMSFAGAPSATSTSSFTVVANDVVPGELGFLLYSYKKANLSYHTGKLCVKAPIMRLFPPKTPKSTGPPPCTGVVKRNFNTAIQSGNDPLLTAGQTVNAQWRLRDPADPAGFGDSLTDGLRFTIAP